VEFSYPSGNLHVGHWYAFSVPDIFARYKRMRGFNVLYPMGFDAFGLPAENAAIKLGADPKVWTYEQMDTMRVQLRSMGAMFDWNREIISCDPKYYKWTQWMFNQFLKHDLVYRDSTMVNWCPKDQSLLALVLLMLELTLLPLGPLTVKLFLPQPRLLVLLLSLEQSLMLPHTTDLSSPLTQALSPQGSGREQL
jgi:hypothetical protein